MKLLQNKDTANMEKFAIKIAKQAKSQNLSAVSFDHRLYPFVKTHLENKISDKIVYHSWHGPSLSNVNFKKDLIANDLFLDIRIKTLLTRYISPFNL
jgi:hypothetical protein